MRSHMKDKMQHPLLVSVFRQAECEYDCTNGGITSKKKQLMLAEPDFVCGMNWPHDPDLAVIRDPNGYMFAVPWEDRHNPRGRNMFGGNLIHTSDSRFPCDYPLKVHDRKE